MSRPKSRSQLKTLTYAEKLAALREVEKGMKSKSQIAKEFGIPPTTLSTYIKNKEKIMSVATNGNDMVRKRAKRPENPDIDECVLKWYRQSQGQKLSPTGTVIRAKAEEFAAQLGRDKFKASSGWLEGFKKRNGISLKVVKEETEEQEVDSWKSDVLNITDGTPTRDIFNVAETGLFYKCTPDNMSTYKEERCSGGEFNEERVTLLLGANMEGTEKLPLLMVGKYTNPKCFKNAQIQVEYKSNKNAWLTSEIFEKWLLELDNIFREQNRTILLFISNRTAHGNIPPTTNVQVVFFRSNLASIQPMDQGIIKEFKHHYRCLVVENFISGAVLDKNGKVKMNILEAGRMCERAWEQVSAKTIIDCFRKAGFVQDDNDTVDVKPLVCNWENVSEEEAARFENFVNFDENVETFGAMTDEEILSEVSSKKTKKTPDESGKTIPTSVEVLGHLQEVRRFVQDQTNAPSYLFHALDSLQHYTLSRAVNSKEQIDISEFFRN